METIENTCIMHTIYASRWKVVVVTKLKESKTKAKLKLELSSNVRRYIDRRMYIISVPNSTLVDFSQIYSSCAVDQERHWGGRRKAEHICSKRNWSYTLYTSRSNYTHIWNNPLIEYVVVFRVLEKLKKAQGKRVREPPRNPSGTGAWIIENLDVLLNFIGWQTKHTHNIILSRVNYESFWCSGVIEGFIDSF